jgi:23S rRNA pseudouridine1911/1915/1917 synthase
VEASAGQAVRLDVYLAAKLSELSRSRIQKLIDAGLVKLDGKAVKASLNLRGGEKLAVTLPANQPAALRPQEIALEIVYEDDYLAVVNKPAGLVVHPGAGAADSTLVNALLYHLAGRLSGISGVLRPGIVHRLDKDTSGLLVVAKEDRAHRDLSEQIRAKTARRVYFALVEGHVPYDSGLVDKPVGRHPVKRKQMAVTAKGRAAVSRYQVVERFAAYTLLKVELETGRTHQIRVHMASLGWPVVGDIVYNRKRTGSLAARAKLGLVGHALHAAYLSFTHPASGALLEFEAALPDDFKRLLALL